MLDHEAEGLTVSSVFLDRVRQDGDQTALWFAVEDQFQSLTWNELKAEVEQVARYLVSCGVTSGDRVVQLAENRREWIVVDLAVLLIGAIHVPLHVSYGKSQIEWMVDHCGAKFAFASTEVQAAKCMACQKLQQIVIFETPWKQVKCSKFRAYGEIETAPTAEVALPVGPKPESTASIVYTSGTTGHPKGVVLSHHNLMGNAKEVLSTYEVSQGIRRLVFLPLSHVYARTCDLYVWLLQGGELMLARSRETILEDCQNFHPTVINAVPYFYEKVATRLKSSGKSDQLNILNQTLGGQIRMCACGGAALPDYVCNYFRNQDVPLYQGYGLTETSPVISTSRKDRSRLGSVGTVLPSVEVKIAEDGEIMTRSPYVMQGYYHDEESTVEVIQDDWLHTGDIGYLDQEGFLFITGRKKDLAVTATGKNISPAQLEILLTADPMIAQAIIICEGRKFVTALIVPDPEHLRAEIKQHRLWVFSKRGALRHRKVRNWYQERITHALKDRASYEQVQRFHLMDRGFTLETGEMTPKLSLKRKMIESNLKTQIEDLYR
ncbi:MAG: AMP-dependent synthetase/ligase [Pirellulales bacterium]